MHVYMKLEGEKHRNHFLSNLVTTLILVMLDAFEANLSNMKLISSDWWVSVFANCVLLIS